MSDDFGLRGPKLPWACPNDRQLALRAKLKTGWSLKTNQFSTYPKPAPLTEREQQMIVSVVKKAEEMDLYEQQRVGKMVDRLESLKKLANGNGVTECVLCGDAFGLSMFGRSNYKCHDCEKAVCRKCVVELSTGKTGSSKDVVIRLCKVCSENRELIKKSGAWFYKGVPKYILPEKKHQYTNNYEKYSATPRSYQEQKYVSRYINAQAEQEPSSSKAGGTSTSTASTRLAGTTTTTSSSNSTTSASRPGGFFWSRNLQNRSGVLSGQTTTTTDVDQESSSGDECASGLLRGSTGGTGPSGLGPKHYYPPHHQSNLSLSCSPGGATASTSSNGSNQNGGGGGGSSNWSGMSTSRGHSPPVSRLHPQRNNTSPLRTSTDTSPGGVVPGMVLAQEEAPTHNQLLASGPNTPAVSRSGSTKKQHHRHGFTLDLSSSSRQIDRFDFSKEALESQRAGNGGGVTTSRSNNGDNNPKTSASSSNDNLYKQGLMGSTNNLTHSMSAASSTASTNTASGGHSTQQQSGLSPSSTSPSPLGTIEVALLYDDAHQALHVNLLQAKDLVPMDINGLADPYCILKLIPSRFEGTHLRTKTIHKSVNPIFNETLTFYGVTPHDLTWQTLQILVMDDDRWGKDCLGTTQISLHRIRSQQTRAFTQNLERGRLSEEREWGRGRLLLSLTYLTEKSLLLVGVIQAQDLPALDHNGTSDPFVKVRLLHDSNLGTLSTSYFSSSSINRKYRTSVKWRTLNPEFREEFSLKVSILDLPRLALVISVWDKDLRKNDDYIGGIVLSNGSKGERLKHWLDMIKLPNTKHFKWHTLSPSNLPNH